MPKRATLTYSSEDANTLQESRVYVYYCKYSGKHALTTDVDMAMLPLRPADKSRVLDTNKFMAKVYAEDGGVKVIRRKDGKVERQHRLNIGRLPVAYRTDPEGTLLYILDNSVSVMNNENEARPPVPPCILASGDKVQVALELEDAAEKPAVVKITADSVLVRITGRVLGARMTEELIEFMGKVLTCRPSQLTLMKGWNACSRLLVVDGKGQEEVFKALDLAIKSSGVNDAA